MEAARRAGINRATAAATVKMQMAPAITDASTAALQLVQALRKQARADQQNERKRQSLR